MFSACVFVEKVSRYMKGQKLYCSSWYVSDLIWLWLTLVISMFYRKFSKIFVPINKHIVACSYLLLNSRIYRISRNIYNMHKVFFVHGVSYVEVWYRARLWPPPLFIHFTYPRWAVTSYASYGDHLTHPRWAASHKVHMLGADDRIRWSCRHVRLREGVIDVIRRSHIYVGTKELWSLPLYLSKLYLSCPPCPSSLFSELANSVE